MNKKMRNILLGIMMVMSIGLLYGCNQKERVDANISDQADSFNIVRTVTVINGITNDISFQMTGKMSITADVEDNQLEVIVEEDGKYLKHIIGLSDNTTYVIEDLGLGANDVSNYKYTMYYNPDMIIPMEAEEID